MTVPKWFAELSTHDELVSRSPLPAAEDDQYEFKSSMPPNGSLAEKLGIAASGFWNTGGGFFICGVDGQGRPDEGMPLKVGRQPLRDWVDQVLLALQPHGPYQVKVLPRSTDSADKGVLVVAFGESAMAPHMAPDGRYYLRAGAHSVRAPAFLVEALFARRQLAQPLLRHVVRVSPKNGRAVQLGIVAASTSPALNVAVDLPALPLIGKAPKTYNVAVVGPDTPFFLDFDHVSFTSGGATFDVEVRYEDAGRRQYREVFTVDVDSQMGPPSFDNRPDLARDALRDIASSIREVAQEYLSRDPRR